MSLSRNFLLASLFAAAAFAASAAVAGASTAQLALPYCAGKPGVDGDLDDWKIDRLELQFGETAGTPTQRNRIRAQACWTIDTFYLSWSLQDADLIAAPAELAVGQYHQYDSVQLYLDPRNDSTAVMNRDDVDLLLLPDGRSGVLRGDTLIEALVGSSVPQRESAPLNLEYATTRTPLGWQAELGVPFAGLGTLPQSGATLKIDLAINDWLVDHPSTPPPPLVPTVTPAIDAGTDRAVGTQVLPRSLSGTTDFGHPANWRVVALTGSVPLSVRLAQRWGVARLLAVAVVGVALVFAVLLSLLMALQRRHLRALVQRLEQAPDARFGAGTPTDGETLDAPAAESAIAPAAVPGVDPREAAFAKNVLDFIRLHIDQTLTPGSLAEHFHVSLRTLQRRLKAGIESSPQDLILAARLQFAHHLLSEGKWRVSEVAHRAGFEDLSHFGKRFRAAYGVSPSRLGEPASH